MRAKLLEDLNPEQTIEITVPASSETNMDVEMDAAAEIPNIQEINACFMDNKNLGSEPKIMNDELCNTEELNLSVTNSVFREYPVLNSRACLMSFFKFCVKGKIYVTSV